MNGASTRAIACGGDPGGKTMAGATARKRLIVGRFEEMAARDGGADWVLGTAELGAADTARNVELELGDRFG